MDSALEAITVMYGYSHDMYGWGYALVTITMIAFWVLVVSVVVRRRGRPHQTSGAAATPEQLLAGRFARGEIGDEEYTAGQVALGERIRP